MKRVKVQGVESTIAKKSILNSTRIKKIVEFNKVVVVSLAIILLNFVVSKDLKAQGFEKDGIHYVITSDVAPLSVKVGPALTKYNGEVTIPASVENDGNTYSVTAIAGYAFYRCEDLTGVNLPLSITKIGRRAFSFCEQLPTVTIPNSVDTIEMYAFSNSGITSIDIPASVKVIGAEVFSFCSKLESINVDASNTEYLSASGVFFNKDQTMLIQYPIGKAESDYTVPNTVTTIGTGSFSNNSLMSITIQNGVDSIKAGAFQNSKFLNTISLPSTVKYLGNGSFSDCLGISSITLPEGLESIANSAFYGCGNLRHLVLPNTTKEIEDFSFYGCDSLSSIVSNIQNISAVTTGTHAFNGVDKANCKIFVPTGKVADYQAANVWKDFSNIQEQSSMVAVSGLSLAENTVNIGINETFMLVANITPNDASNKGMLWESSDPNIAKVVSGSIIGINHGNATITGTTIDGAKQATCQVNVLDEEVGRKFKIGKIYYKVTKASPLEVEVTTEIDGYPFYSNPNEIPKGDITLPANVNNSGKDYAVTAIGESTFTSSGGGLTSINFPNSIRIIKDAAFSNCVSLNALTLPSSLEEIGGGAFAYCNGLTALVIPEGVTKIGSSAFHGCQNLNSLNISTTLEHIGGESFYDCIKLSFIISNIEDVNNVTMGSSMVFKNVNKAKCKLFVPTGKVSDYQAADVWKDFNIIAEISSIVPVTGLSLNETTKNININENFTLIPNVSPNSASDKAVIWKSSNVNVVRVSAGVVTGRSKGTATITATTQDGNKTASCEVTVIVPVVGVSLNITTKKMGIGETFNLEALINPDNANNTNVTWTSSDDNVATVDNIGKVTAIAVGLADIKVTTEDGNYEATCQVEVVSGFISVTEISLNETTKTLAVGEDFTLVATINPNDATNKNVTWTSSDDNIATVDNTGKVTAIAAGSANIKVATEDGNKQAICEVTVTVPVVAISLSETTKALTVGEDFTLVATINPNDATNKNVTWTSSDDNIATVDNAGKVTAIAAGSANIKVATEDGNKQAICEVTVSAIQVESISLNVSDTSIEKSKTFTLVATVLPENATNKNVTWTSSDDNIATVDNTGKVSAVKEGEAIITATTEDGSKTATCKVKVTIPSGIKDAGKTQVFSVYPSVVNDRFVVESSAINGKLSIYSLTGKKVYEQVLKSKKEEINITHIESGVYMVRINDKIVKIVKQ